MVVTKTLEDVSIETLLATFNEAFSVYEIPVLMTKEQLLAHTRSIGYKKEDSIGLFDQHHLVGFLQVARRGDFAYDGATGIIPSYQGKGLAHLLIDRTITHLKENKVKTFILEVIDTNTRAKNLYLKHGFHATRTLLCYQIETKELSCRDSSSIKLVARDELPLVEAECKPSWQNSNESVKDGDYSVMDIIAEGKKRGYICFNLSKGSIAQIFIYKHERRNGYASKAIIACSKLAITPTIGMLNVDGDYEPIHRVLAQMGFTLKLTQTEMERSLL